MIKKSNFCDRLLISGTNHNAPCASCHVSRLQQTKMKGSVLIFRFFDSIFILCFETFHGSQNGLINFLVTVCFDAAAAENQRLQRMKK